MNIGASLVSASENLLRMTFFKNGQALKLVL